MFRCCKKVEEEIPLIHKKVLKRILLVGKPQIGKTLWIQSIATPHLLKSDVYKPTIGIEYYSLYYSSQDGELYSLYNIEKVFDKKVLDKIAICDTGGEPRYYSILETCVKTMDEVWVAIESVQGYHEQIEYWKNILKKNQGIIYRGLLLPNGIILS